MYKLPKLPIINIEKTGKNIASLRKQNGILVRELQEIFGFSTPQAIYKWQQGVSIPSIDNLLILSHIFKVPMENILVYEN